MALESTRTRGKQQILVVEVPNATQVNEKDFGFREVQTEMPQSIPPGLPLVLHEAGAKQLHGCRAD